MSAAHPGPATPPPTPPESPAAGRLSRARWGDSRLLLGVLLVMTSVVVGSRVVAGAERTEQVWVVAADLAPGTRLTPADLEPRAVRLGSVSGRYLRVAAGQVSGEVLLRSVSAGELLPAAAVSAIDPAHGAQLRQVTVPVEPFHYPPGLARGRLVDVYVTTGGAAASGAGGVGSAGNAAASPELLLPGVLVVSVDDSGSRFGGSGATVGVVLSVAEEDVASLLAGLRSGPVDLAGVVGQ